MADLNGVIPPKIGNAFTRKLGPLPGWAWLLIVVAGAYAVYYYRVSRGGSTAPVTLVESTGTPDLPDNPDRESAPVTPVVADNGQWARTVVTGLIASGQYNATDVNNAISNYLNGVKLSAKHQAIVSIALQRYGVPPEGIIPIVGTDYGNLTHPILVIPKLTPTPAPAPAPAPAPTHTYTVRRGDNLSSIATKFYGTANWQKIFDANRAIIRDPNLIYAGQVLQIP